MSQYPRETPLPRFLKKLLKNNNLRISFNHD
jgi:hypothetical protein